MLFHSCNVPAMKACKKRAARFAKQGAVSGQQKVWLSNAMALSDGGNDVLPISVLAEKINRWCETNLIEGNEGMAALLYEWRQMLFFDPECLPDDIGGRYHKSAKHTQDKSST